MGQVTTFKDRETDATYTVSTVKNNKKVSVNNKTYETVYESALLSGKSLHAKTSKPICVFELIDNPRSDMSLEDFHNKLLNLIEDHSINELLKDSSVPLYLEEGFYCQIAKSFQLFALSKTRLFYLFPIKPEYSKHDQTGEEYYYKDTVSENLSTNTDKLPSAQSIYKDGDFVRALGLKYYEIVDEEIDRVSKNFKQYLLELSKHESREICLMGYTLRKAEKELVNKSIQHISPEIIKILNSESDSASKCEEIANYLDENNSLGLGNRAKNYTLLPIQDINEMLSIFVDDLLERLELEDSSSANEVFFRLITFGYLFRIADEIINSNLINSSPVKDGEVVYSDEDTKPGQIWKASDGQTYTFGQSTAKEVEDNTKY